MITLLVRYAHIHVLSRLLLNVSSVGVAFVCRYSSSIQKLSLRGFDTEEDLISFYITHPEVNLFFIPKGCLSSDPFLCLHGAK